jgi:hypothetical protein
MMAGAIACVVSIAFALIFSLHRFDVPIGWDTPNYAWLTNVARQEGIGHLPASLPPPGPTHAGRAGTLVLGAIISSIGSLHPLRLSEVLPGVMAGVAGLGAAAFVSVAFGLAGWELAVTAIGVGTSAFLVHVVNVEVYQDASIATALFMASATPVLLSVSDRASLIPACVLLGAFGLVHWNYFEAGAAILLAAAGVFAPGSWRRFRARELRLQDTATMRLVIALAGGAVVALAAIFAVLSRHLPSALLIPGQLVNKLRRDVPSYHLPLVIVAAVLGAFALSRPASATGQRGGRARLGLVLLVTWSEVVFLGYLIQRTFGRPVPTHRLLAFDLGLPILGVVGVLWIAQGAGRLWQPLTFLVSIGLVGAAAYGSLGTWYGFRPVLDGPELVQANAAADYLRQIHVPADTPVVFVVAVEGSRAWSQAWITGHAIRSVMPPQRLSRLFLFIGSPEEYLSAGTGAHVPTNGIKRFYFGEMEQTYAKRPIALVLAAVNPGFHGWIRTHPERVVAPGVAVVRGPLSPVDHPSRPPVGVSSGWLLVTASVGIVALLIVVGGGWSIALMWPRAGRLAVAALAPAMGTAFLILGGVVLNRLGIPLRGLGAWIVPVLLASGGWAAAWKRTGGSLWAILTQAVRQPVEGAE